MAQPNHAESDRIYRAGQRVSLNPFHLSRVFTDGTRRMVAVAALAMTIFHPGYCFPQMVSQARKSKVSDLEDKVVSETSLKDTRYSAYPA